MIFATKKQIHKKLVAANNVIRERCNVISMKMAVFNRPSVHFCERLLERVPIDQHEKVIDMITNYMITNNAALAKRDQGEVILNSKKYSVKMAIEPAFARTLFDENGTRTKLINLVTITPLG